MSDKEAKKLVKILRRGTEYSAITVMKSLGLQYERINRIRVRKPGYQWLPRTLK